MRSRTGLMPTRLAQLLWPRVQDAIAAMEQVIEPARFDPATPTTSSA